MEPARMDHDEKMRLRAAAFQVTRLYPGPPGLVLSRELMAWEEFGFRFGDRSIIPQLVDHILQATAAKKSKVA